MTMVSKTSPTGSRCMPEVCESSWRMVTPACELSERCCSTVSSRSSRPSSRNAMIATAVKVLELLATAYWVSSSGASPGESRSMVPMPRNHSRRPLRATPAARPGTRPSVCAMRARAVRARAVSSVKAMHPKVSPVRGSGLDEALVLEPGEGDLGGVLAVDVDLGVELDEDVVGELLGDRV